MTLSECIELLRGKPSRPALSADEVPCVETSDDQKLCRNPVVSVRMVTFNHEPYIRQAIESVMMQQSDFEYELVIGEDASTDRTREICFELQKKYPDRIRVLWSEKNLFAINGNAIRVDARCRGEYAAYLEGDDYWTNPLKLQKQMDLIRKTGSVGCFAWRKDLLRDGSLVSADSETKPFLNHQDLRSHYYHTSTYIYQRSVIELVMRKYPDIVEWYDTQMAQCVCAEGKICLLPEEVSVYRQTGTGIATSCQNVHQRLALSMSQLIPMYLYGPEKLRREHGLMALMMLAHSACPKETGYTEESFRSVRKELYGLFWALQRRLFPDRRALGWILRLAKYRMQAMLAKNK